MWIVKIETYDGKILETCKFSSQYWAEKYQNEMLKINNNCWISVVEEIKNIKK